MEQAQAQMPGKGSGTEERGGRIVLLIDPALRGTGMAGIIPERTDKHFMIFDATLIDLVAQASQMNSELQERAPNVDRDGHPYYGITESDPEEMNRQIAAALYTAIAPAGCAPGTFFACPKGLPEDEDDLVAWVERMIALFPDLSMVLVDAEAAPALAVQAERRMSRILTRWPEICETFRPEMDHSKELEARYL